MNARAAPRRELNRGARERPFKAFGAARRRAHQGHKHLRMYAHTERARDAFKNAHRVDAIQS
jgi:hypothetical protein